MSVPIIGSSRKELRLHVEDTRVQLIIDGRLVADLPWEAAQDLSRKLMSRAKVAEQNHWQSIEKFQAVPVKHVFGMPVVTTYKQFERLGDI